MRFFTLHDNFTVLASRLVCEKPFNNRCVKHYIVERPNGLSHDFVTLGYEIIPGGFLPKMKFKKVQYSFSFVLNNKTKTWFLLRMEIEFFSAGLLLFIAWLILGGPKNICKALVILEGH